MCGLVGGGTAVIRIDAIWMATEPLEMRAGRDTAQAHVVKVFGAAHAHHAYLFTNKSATRIKVLVYDSFGIWLAARRLNRSRFVWNSDRPVLAVTLNAEQLANYESQITEEALKLFGAL